MQTKGPAGSRPLQAELGGMRHAVGVPRGEPRDAGRAEAHAKVFSAPRALGFCEGQARAVL